MAKNLRAKIPASDTLIIRDVNKDVMQRFVEETKTAGSVEIADNPREVAEKAVSKGIFFIIPECRMHVVVLLRGLLRQFASVARLEAGSLESLDSVYRDIASSMKRAVLTKFWLTISNEEKKILPNTYARVSSCFLLMTFVSCLGNYHH